MRQTRKNDGEIELQDNWNVLDIVIASALISCYKFIKLKGIKRTFGSKNIQNKSVNAANTHSRFMILIQEMREPVERLTIHDIHLVPWLLDQDLFEKFFFHIGWLPLLST